MLIMRLAGLAAELERRPGALAAAKLINVALAMAWGFVVTFVFVRLLPLTEFRAFLLLIAFANFTVSAELGLTAIAYSRLRKDRVAGTGNFHSKEIVALFWLMALIILAGACAIGIAMVAGAIKTDHPTLFLSFYAVSAINLLAVLGRRALAALDHNIWWEALEFIRRSSGIGLLLASLAGLPILPSVLLQLVISLLMLWAGLQTIHGTLAMAPGDWLSPHAGARHVREHYLADFGRTGALTLFDVAAYNAPYFTIAAATHDARPMLLFDFAFKISRALSAIIRALMESLLPNLTRAFFGGQASAFRSGLGRSTVLVLTVAAGSAGAIIVGGGYLVRLLFAGHLSISGTELGAVALLLAGLSAMCLSVYLQNGLGRFGALVRPSFVFLVGSLASVPVAAMISHRLGKDFPTTFIVTYAGVHLLLGLVHIRMLTHLGTERPA